MNLTTSFPAGALALLALCLPSQPKATTTGPEPGPAAAPGAIAAPLQDEETEPRPEVAYFRAKNMNPGALSNTVQQLIYGSGVLGDIDTGTQYRSVSTQVVDDMLVVSALPSLMPQVLELLGELDEEAGRPNEEADDRRIATFQYQLRFASHAAVSRALEPFLNFGPTQGGTSADPRTRFTIVEETGTVVARASVATIAEIRRVIEEIDVPEPQVRLTYYLIEGLSRQTVLDTGLDPDELNVGVPEELVRDLGALLPVEGFHMLSFGVLQGDALAQRRFNDEFGGSKMQLDMVPTTFDRQTGALGIDRIEFGLFSNSMGGRTKSFTTSAQLEPGRYTVLGGVGADPVFVVLHMSRM